MGFIRDSVRCVCSVCPKLRARAKSGSSGAEAEQLSPRTVWFGNRNNNNRIVRKQHMIQFFKKFTSLVIKFYFTQFREKSLKILSVFCLLKEYLESDLVFFLRANTS